MDAEPVTDPVNLTKALVGGITAIGAVPAAVEAIERAERLVLGIPQSVLLCAFVGVLVGVLLLPEREADRVTPDSDLFGRGPRLWQMSLRVALLAVLLLAYAFVAAWLVEIAAHFMPSLGGAPQLPMAGISGVLVRRMLPRYLQIVERATTPAGAGK